MTGTDDPDYDEDSVYDWVLYVDSVEQLSLRECGSPRTPTSAYTPTKTATETPIPPTATPTPAALDCADVYISNPGGLQRGIDNRPDLVDRINMDVANDHPIHAAISLRPPSTGRTPRASPATPTLIAYISKETVTTTTGKATNMARPPPSCHRTPPAVEASAAMMPPPSSSG